MRVAAVFGSVGLHDPAMAEDEDEEGEGGGDWAADGEPHEEA